MRSALLRGQHDLRAETFEEVNWRISGLNIMGRCQRKDKLAHSAICTLSVSEMDVVYLMQIQVHFKESGHSLKRALPWILLLGFWNSKTLFV